MVDDFYNRTDESDYSPDKIQWQLIRTNILCAFRTGADKVLTHTVADSPRVRTHCNDFGEITQTFLASALCGRDMSSSILYILRKIAELSTCFDRHCVHPDCNVCHISHCSPDVHAVTVLTVTMMMMMSDHESSGNASIQNCIENFLFI